MPPEVAVGNPEAEADHVQIGNYRAEGTNQQDPFGNAGAIKACSNCESCGSV